MKRQYTITIGNRGNRIDLEPKFETLKEAREFARQTAVNFDPANYTTYRISVDYFDASGAVIDSGVMETVGFKHGKEFALD